MSKRDVVDEISCSCLSRPRAGLGGRYVDLRRGAAAVRHQGEPVRLAGCYRQGWPRASHGHRRYADLDPSTLTRNLAVMATNGWIEDVIEGDDGRGDPVRITAKGRHLIDSVAPGWKKAQQRARKFLGDERAASLISLFQAPPPG